MITRTAATYLRLLILLVLTGASHVGAQPAQIPQIPQIPAFLPNVDSVPEGRRLQIDGQYRISSIGKRIRIEAGRAYAVDSWLHLFVLKVQPYMVVIKDIQAVGRNRYSGNDLPLMGRWEATRESSGDLAVTVAGAFGPVKYRLIREDRGYPRDDFDDEDSYEEDPYEEDPYGEDPYDEDRYGDEDAYDEEDYDEDYSDANEDNDDYIAPSPYPIPSPWPKPQPLPRPVANDVTPNCGGAGQAPCAVRPARFVSKAKNLGCPGKQNYFSTLRGGSCWSCPNGYKRTHRKMDHKKACVKRKSLTGPWTKAKFTSRAWGCPAGQFHMGPPGGGKCMACPSGYKRVHVAGADTGQCKPVDKCDGNFRPAKQPPKDKVLDSILGTTRNKVCAPRFNLKTAAKRDLPKFKAFKSPGIALVEDIVQNKKRRRALKRAIKRKDYDTAFRQLRSLSSYAALVDMARASGFDAFSIGFGSDVQIGVGGNGELGFAVDLKRNRLTGFESVGFSKGLSIGIDSGVTLGLWKGGFESGYTQGFTASVGSLVSAGAGIWYTYFDPRGGQERIAGITFTGGVGVGIEFGEFNEVGTRVFN